MILRRVLAWALTGPVFAACAAALPQNAISQTDLGSLVPRTADALPAIVEQIEIRGLRRIAPAAVRAQLTSREGLPFDERRIKSDVQTLSRLEWFDEIHVKSEPVVSMDALAGNVPPRLRLIFDLAERPFLTGINFTGSRLLSRARIDKLLDEKQLTPRLGVPENASRLHLAAQAIVSALNELGHPQARVQLRREEFANATVRVQFVISDGPHLPVGQVQFVGHPEISSKRLARQMQRIAPSALFAELRGRNAYTRAAVEEDRERLLAYYQNHGYPEARIGAASISTYKSSSVYWFPWPHHAPRARLVLTIPVESGPFYWLRAVETSAQLDAAAGRTKDKLTAMCSAQKGQPYSALAMERLRRAWLDRVQRRPRAKGVSPPREVALEQTLDRASQTVRVKLDLRDPQPLILRRIEFSGLHRFNDRYVRRRLLLEEGAPFNERVLEAGLARVARTGYLRPSRKEDIHLVTDETTHTSKLTIRMEEIGRQRASLVGGHAAFGSTLGIAYTVFDLLHLDELLSTQIEGGPESLQVALGLAKEGFLGSRGALAISLFQNVLRPRLAGSVTGPLDSSESEGFSAGWGYNLTTADSVAVNYSLSHSVTRYSLALPAGITGLTASQIRGDTSSRSLGFNWTHDTGAERLLLTDSVSGGWLGGNENLLRSSGEYGHIFSDPFSRGHDAWAFRATWFGVGSYRGDMPLAARLLAGDDLVRGLRPGELGPYASVSSLTSSGATKYSAAPAGADLITAANGEYRVPLGGGTQAAGFFDLGSGWLLPNWLGGARPALLGATNGALHGSTGLELRWTVPGVQIPVRAYYAVNLLRLNRSAVLPDGSLFRLRNRFSAFGWALGTLF